MKVKTPPRSLHSDTVRTLFAQEIHRETIYAGSGCTDPVPYYCRASQSGRWQSREQVLSKGLHSRRVANSMFTISQAACIRCNYKKSCGGNLVGPRRFFPYRNPSQPARGSCRKTEGRSSSIALKMLSALSRKGTKAR